MRRSLLESRIWKVINFINFYLHKVKFQRRTYFLGKVIVSCEKYAVEKIDYPTIEIGHDVKFNSGKIYNLIGGDDRCILRTVNNGKIVIGNNVGISNSTIVAYNSVIIEDGVLLGGGGSENI